MELVKEEADKVTITFTRMELVHLKGIISAADVDYKALDSAIINMTHEEAESFAADFFGLFGV